jgi:hypothetical protein
MTAASASLDVAWCSPDGRAFSIDPAGLGIDVAAGVRIDVAIEPRGAARLAVALVLAGRRSLHGQATEAGARFVVIPLADASFLVCVAEPSDDPVALTPVPSSPAWTRAGAEMPTRDGWLTARRPEGAGIEFRIVPAPEDMSVCALQVSALPPAGGRFTAGGGPGPSGSVRFSVPRMSPQALALECEWEFHAAGRASPSWP